MADKFSIQLKSFLPHKQPEFREMFSIMGEALVFQSNHSMLIDLAKQAFGGFGEPVYETDSPLEITLFVREDHNHEPDSRLEKQHKPEYQVHKHLFSVQLAPGSFAMADLASGIAFGYVGASYLFRPVFLRYALIEALGLAMLGLGRDFFVLHAACVRKNGLSIILQGRAGVGKSTLAYACARRGYQVLAEDSVQVKVGRGDVHLWGAAWKLHLLPDVVGFFPELSDQEIYLDMNGETKLEVALEELWGGSTITDAEPGVIILLSRDVNKPMRLERIKIPASEPVLEVIWSWPQGWDKAMNEGAQLLLQGGIYRLNLNGHPEQCVEILDALVDSLTGPRRVTEGKRNPSTKE